MTPLAALVVCAMRVGGTWATASVIEGAYEFPTGPAPLVQMACPEALPPPPTENGVLCLCPAGMDCTAWAVQIDETNTRGECIASVPE